MTFIPNVFLPYLSLVLTVCLAIGGLYAFRQGSSRESGQMQDRVINTLKAEVESLRNRIVELERQNVTQEHVQETIISALDKEGFKISIDGDMVTVLNRNGAKSSLRRRATPRALPIVPKEQKP